MVLWEITLGTAYFLGLRRTYRLALQIQNRLIKPQHPKIRKFVHGRIRAVFDMALTVHRNVQQRDLEVGRNLGNKILRWLDHMKPSAQIRPPPSVKPPITSSTSMTKPFTHTNIQKSNIKGLDRESNRRLFSSSMRVLPKHFPAIAKMMRPPGMGIGIQSRHFFGFRPNMPRSIHGSEGVIRSDIMQWMLRN